LINHGIAATEPQAATAALNAGVDMEMVSRSYNENGARLLKEGKISQATLDEAVRRILRIKFRLGLFDKPYTDESLEGRVILSPENQAAAREVAARSMVLLRNERNLLPLSKDTKSIALIGPFVDDQLDLMGSWNGDGRAEDVVTIQKGISLKVSPKTKLTVARGCDAKCETTDGFADAVSVARNSDVAVVVIGESADMSGEASSRAVIDLPGHQLELIKQIQATGKPTVVVLLNGRPLTINWMAENTPAILESWFPGTQGGNAIADVLFGDCNPSGRLPFTYPRHTNALMNYDHKRYETEEQPFSQEGFQPQFEFGSGLSYTTFAYSNMVVTPQKIGPGQNIKVSVDVKNTGQREGKEVVELYLSDLVASITPPGKRLVRFGKIHLAPGESRTLSFTIAPEDLSFIGADLKPTIEPGEFVLAVGGLHASFSLAPGRAAASK